MGCEEECPGPPESQYRRGAGRGHSGPQRTLGVAEGEMKPWEGRREGGKAGRGVCLVGFHTNTHLCSSHSSM